MFLVICWIDFFFPSLYSIYFCLDLHFLWVKVICSLSPFPPSISLFPFEFFPWFFTKLFPPLGLSLICVLPGSSRVSLSLCFLLLLLFLPPSLVHFLSLHPSVHLPLSPSLSAPSFSIFFLPLPHRITV